MAIFGIGAYHNDEDVSGDFIENQVACIGWSIDDAPSLHHMLGTLKIGDLIYIKSAPIGKLRIKAVGIIINNEIKTVDKLGKGLTVNWTWRGVEKFDISDKYNVRNNSLYEEFNSEIQKFVIEKIISK